MGRYNYYYQKRHNQNQQNQEIQKDLEQQVEYQENNEHQQSQQSNKKGILGILGVLVLVIGLVGITYAFFNYTRTGTSNNIKVGKISFSSNQTESINLTNVFPISSTQAATDTTNTDEAVITITGDTTYQEGIEYILKAVDVSNTVGSGTNAKTVPIKLLVTASNGLGTADDDYFDHHGGDSSIYKVLYEGVLEEDRRFLVGYIKPGAAGIDGTITIKAYFDSSMIGISDTYNGTESDNMGTTNEWAAGKTILTTSEWNSLQSSGVSFKVKVEANEGIWVNDTLYNEITSDAEMDNVNSTYVQNVSTNGATNAKVTFLNNVENQGKIIKLSAGIDFTYPSGNANGKGLYILSETANDEYPIYYYRGDVYNNNVTFANYCWLIVRTTDTGGVKMIYNGPMNVDGTCTASGEMIEEVGDSSEEVSDEVSEEVSEETSDESSGEVSGSRRKYNKALIKVNGVREVGYNSEEDMSYLFSNGYVFNRVYSVIAVDYNDFPQNVVYGNGFTYSNGIYTLTGVTSTWTYGTQYTCINSTGICDGSSTGKIYYVIDNNPYHTYVEYIEITDGKGIDEAIAEAKQNVTDSYAKTAVDTWYASKLSNYTSKIEDTVYCNDRTLDEHGLSGVYGFENEERIEAGTIQLTCPKNDGFTVSNPKGNQSLTYPVGMITADELVLAGAGNSNETSEDFYLNIGVGYWTMTPYNCDGNATLLYDGRVQYMILYYDFGYGIRPVISLKNTAEFISGDGTMTDPYKVL